MPWHQTTCPWKCLRSASGSRYVGSHDVGGVAIEGDPRPVVAHRGPRIGVGGCFLDIAKWYSCVEGCGDEGVSQGMGSDRLVDPRLLGDALHDAPRSVTVEAIAAWAEEDRSVRTLTDGQIDCPCRAGRKRNGHDLSALSEDYERPVPSFETQGLDIRTKCL